MAIRLLHDHTDFYRTDIGDSTSFHTVKLESIRMGVICPLIVRYRCHLPTIRAFTHVPKANTNLDPVRPDGNQIARVFSRSKKAWPSFTTDTSHQQALPSSCFDSSKALNRVPAIPDGSLSPHARHLEKAVNSDQLIVFGHSSWNITGSDGCGLGGSLKDTGPCPITIGVRNPTTLTDGIEPNHSRKGVITAIITAVAYIFSKRLVELQGDGDGASLLAGNVSYTKNVAPIVESESADSAPGSASREADVYIGEADDEITRWWQALLAQGQGWMARVATDSKGHFLAPWALSIGDKIAPRIQRSGSKLQTWEGSPPSALRAKELLIDFCRLHNANNEFSAAIAVASILPIHNLYGLPVNYQWSQLNHLPHQYSETLDFRSEFFWDRIAQHITLSCHPKGIMSNLCGAFWEPDVPCNVVHAWFHAFLPKSPVTDYFSTKDAFHRALVTDCAARRPNIACYFLGAILTDLMPLVVHLVKSGLPVLDPDAAAWSDCKQSFIQDSGHMQPTSRNFMLRADVWRLLYITGEYPAPPLTPWKPFGEMRVDDISLPIREHQQCGNDHYLRYRRWSWRLVDGSLLEDASNPEGSYEETSTDLSSSANPRDIPCVSLRSAILEDTASENATRSVFQWVTVNGDGYPPSERDIYNHEWINAGDGSPEYSSHDDSDSGHSSISRLQDTQNWIMQV